MGTSNTIKKVPLPSAVFFQEGPGLRNWQWKESGMKVINVTNILSDGSLDTSNTNRHISMDEFAEKYQHFAIEAGDILIASSGNTYGKISRIQKEQLPIMMNTSVIRLHSADKSVLDDEYLFAYMRTSIFRDQIESYVTGSAQPNFGPSHLKKMVILLPKIKDQKMIGDFVHTFDALNQNNSSRIWLLEQMAHAIYTEWFVNFHFPDHEKVKMVDSGTDFGKIPEGWEVKKLGNKINISRGKNITKDTIEEGNVPVVAGGLEPAYFHSTANTLAPVITISASGANAGFVNLYMEDVWASDCSYIDKSVTPFVLYYFLLLKSRQVEVTGLQRGSAQPHVYPKDLSELLVVDVPDNLLKSFEDIVGAVFSFVGNLKKQNKSLRDSRDLLLPKLVTGEIRV